jgi:tyrosyl-tRNA synthetase
MELLDDLAARDLLADGTDRGALAKRLAEGRITVYHGCDPSADSLHHGNLIGLIVLRRFVDAGHHAIALAGGATGMVGDPGGRSEERNLLDEETLGHNVARIKEQISRVLGPEGDWKLVDNRDWTEGLGVLEFLRDVGKHVTVNTMLHKESVRARVQSEHGISYTEFSYMLLQAFDFLWLYEHESCELQVGGSDQWGNISAGVDLIRRKTGHAAHAFTWPLITKADGTKFGKTAGGSLWLAPDRTSPYQFFQYWMQADDRDVGPWLRKFTLLPLGQIAEIEQEHLAAPERRLAQRVLAREVTTLVHGPEETGAAEEASGVLFGSSLEDVSEQALEAIAGEVPTSDVARSRFDEGIEPVDLFAEVGLSASKSDARRTLQQGGMYVNNRKVEPDAGVVTAGDLLYGHAVLLRRGKRDYHLVRAV